MRLLIAAAIAAALRLAAAAGVLFLVLCAAVYAQDTNVTVPWGDWLAEVIVIAGQIVALAIGGLLMWALRFLPPTLAAYIKDQQIKQIEQLLGRAVDYGTNAVAGAVRGQELSVAVGSKVVAEAAQYAIDHGPEKLIAWAGGAAAIKEMILARIPLQASATAGDVLDNAPPVSGE